MRFSTRPVGPNTWSMVVKRFENWYNRDWETKGKPCRPVAPQSVYFLRLFERISYFRLLFLLGKADMERKMGLNPCHSPMGGVRIIDVREHPAFSRLPSTSVLCFGR